MMITNRHSITNDVNGNNSQSEVPSSGGCPVGEQRRPDRQTTTARHNWSSELNKIAMRCFYSSDWKRKGYGNRMLAKWNEIGLFECSAGNLIDRCRVIKSNGYLSEIELEEIKREVLMEDIDVDKQPEVENEPDEERQPDAENELDVERQPGVEKRPDMEKERDEQEETPLDRIEELTVSQQVEELITAVRHQERSYRLKEDIDEENLQIANEIIESMETCESPPNLRHIERKKLKEEVKKVNEALKYMTTQNITDTNKLLKAAGCVVAKRLGVKKKKKGGKVKEPWWKRRIKNKIEKMRKELSRLDRWKKQEVRNQRLKEEMKKKYQMKNKSIDVVIEELKQRIVANSMKLKRYEARTEQYIQNRLFQTNQKKLFERLENTSGGDQEMPEKETTVKFWSDIWSQPVNHNEEAKWMNRIESELKRERTQEDLQINLGKLKRQLKRVANWRAPGPDGLQGYWIKAFDACHQRITIQLQQCLDTGEVPDWLTQGKTTLIMKDKEKGPEVTNYRPITCLPLMWKILTGIISNAMYEHLDDEQMLPVEQKGCRRKSRGTKDQLLIDKMILKNSRRRATHLGMAWIDYKKAYDMIPHSWIKKCLDMFNIASNIKRMIKMSMDKWNTELMANGEKIGSVHIKRGIFQGDSLSPLLFVMALIPLSLVLRQVKCGYSLGRGRATVNHLLFMDDLKVYGKNINQVDTLVNTVKIFSQDIGMQFGIKKCAVLIMKRGKVVESNGILLPDEQQIKSLRKDEGYKYLGILEADQIKSTEMKTNVTKEYYRRIRKILKSKLNAGNTINAINSRAVSLVRYGAGILQWKKDELRKMDRKTRKMLTTYRALHPQADVDRLYLKRNEGGRGMISVEDCIDLEVGNLKEYVNESEEEMLKEVAEEEIIGEGKQKKDVLDKHKSSYLDKVLHGQFFRKTEEVRDENSWNWLKQGYLKRETEGMLMAAQDQALRSNAIKHRIDKAKISPLCRLCGERDETVAHIVAECKMLAQKQYKLWRHDRVATVIHWTFCKKYGFDAAEKWYDHQPNPVIENEKTKILWDFAIQTDHQIEHNKPDIVLIKKDEKECLVIDVACPFDSRIKLKEGEKIERYQDLKRETKKLWKMKKASVIPVVIGALGTISKNFNGWIKKLEIDDTKDLMQKACLLGTAKIIRKVLDT